MPMPNRPPTFGHKPTPPRPSAAKRGYGRKWRDYCKQYLAGYRLCRGVNGEHHPKCLRLAQCVDHIKPAKSADDPLFWEGTNHQPLSLACHQLKSERDGTRRRDGGRWA